MIQYFLMIFLIMNSMIFLNMNHPLSMGLLLMTQTLLICLYCSIYSYTYWFSYSLFLIFMGGMLILFMYMTSLASNETFKFKLNFNVMILWILFPISIMMIFYLFDIKILMMEMMKINDEKSSLTSLLMLTENNKMMLNKMYNFPMNLITILLVFYLLLTLITSVKITNIFKGPLRTK